MRMWQGKRRHQHTQMLASVEKGTEAQSSEKSRQVTSARIAPEIPNIVPKHHCANITPASFRTVFCMGTLHCLCPGCSCSDQIPSSKSIVHSLLLWRPHSILQHRNRLSTALATIICSGSSPPILRFLAGLSLGSRERSPPGRGTTRGTMLNAKERGNVQWT